MQEHENKQAEYGQEPIEAPREGLSIYIIELILVVRPYRGVMFKCCYNNIY